MANQASQGSKGYPFPLRQEPVSLADIDNFLDGLFTDAAPDKIPQSALTVAFNLEYFRKQLFRRNGYIPWPTNKPNSAQVQGIFPFTESVTGLNILRFTPATVYKSTSAGWIQFTPNAIAANSGGINDYFSFASIDNRGFFANGVDPIREVVPSTTQYQAVGNAPIYKYICGAFNRIIGVNLVAGTDIPYQVGWCGETNYTEWDPLVDISAGHQNLISSPSGLSDDGTGIFSTGQLLVIPRTQSIWLALKQPSATSPFSFFAQLPHIGADLPRTICLTDYGLVWVENSSSSVFAWQIGTPVNKPEDIDVAQKVKRSLRIALNNANQVWASYSNETRNYTIFIAYSNTSTVSLFTFNFITGAWTTGSIGGSGGPTCCTDIPFSNSAVTINELSGSINALLGTINSLGGLTQNATRAAGYSNGDISRQETYSGLSGETAPVTADQTETNASVFATQLGTKTIEVPVSDVYINLVRFSIIPYSTGSVTLSYSKDDGNTVTDLKTITFVSGDLNKFKFIQLKKSLKMRRVIWYLTTNNCMCALNGFYVRALASGVSKK